MCHFGDIFDSEAGTVIMNSCGRCAKELSWSQYIANFQYLQIRMCFS